MAEAAFLELLTHTCDVEVSSSSSDDDYGHPSESWSVESSDQACLWQPEVERSIDGTTVISHGTLFIVYGSSWDETRRIADVKDSDGTVLEAGPLQIVEMVDAGGQEHHYELKLRRGDVRAVS